MSHRHRCHHFLLLLLVIATSLSFVAGQDDEPVDADDAVEIEVDIEQEIEALDKDYAESTTSAVTPEPDPEGEALTVEHCEEAPESIKSKCCKMMLDVDNDFIKCMMLHQKKMPKEGEENPVAMIKFASCLIECVYKSKKFIMKDNKINLKMVKAEAKKTYKNDVKQQEYMYAQFEHCERQAHLDWAKLKKNPAAKIVFKGACKPYYVFVFVCVTDYGKISCPYFKWEGTKELKDECKSLKNQCKAIVG